MAPRVARESLSAYGEFRVGAARNCSRREKLSIPASLNAVEIGGVLRSGVASRSAERLATGGLFIFIGADAETGWLPPDIAFDDRGFVLTGADVKSADAWRLERDPYLLETSVPGIFACGDVRSGPVKRVAAAVGEGSMAIAFVHQFLRDAAPELALD